MTLSRCLAQVVLVTMLSTSAVKGIDPPRYEYRSTNNPAGTGKFYQGREIAGVASGSEWDPTFREEVSGLLKRIGVLPGQVVADVGAGYGDLSLLLAQSVGTAGAVYAVDIDPGALDAIRQRAVRQGVHNVLTVRGSQTSPLLSRAAFDFILVVHAYHEFSHPWEMTSEMVAALKEGGRLVVIESRQERAKEWHGWTHSMSEEQMLKEMRPFPLRRVPGYSMTLANRHVFVFEKSRVTQRPGVPAPDVVEQLEEIRSVIREMRNELARLRDGSPSKSKKDSYPEGRMAEVGRIWISNQYPQPVTVVVDGQHYRLPPGSSRLLTDHPAGIFTYEVIGVQSPVTRRLIRDSTFTINVHPSW